MTQLRDMACGASGCNPGYDTQARLLERLLLNTISFVTESKVKESATC